MSQDRPLPGISTIVLGGKKYPRCEFCPFRLSPVAKQPGRHMSEDELKAAAHRYTEHLRAEHPEKLPQKRGD